VEGADVDVSGSRAEHGSEPRAQHRGGCSREGDREDARRWHAALRDQAADTAGQGSSLAAAGSGEDSERPLAAVMISRCRGENGSRFTRDRRERLIHLDAKLGGAVAAAPGAARTRQAAHPAQEKGGVEDIVGE
jgi:hypothetical protein